MSQPQRPTVGLNYSSVKTHRPSGPRRIPLIRLVVVFFLFYEGFLHREKLLSKTLWVQSQVRSFFTETFFQKFSSEPEKDLSHQERLTLQGGKRFHLRHGWMQESWRIRGGADLDSVADSYENEKIASLIRTLAENRPLSSPEGLLDLVFTDTTAGNLPRLARWRDSLGSVSIAWMPMEGGALKGRFLDLNTRCVWLEPCPEEPLPGGAVPIGASFDFAGREYLMTHDLFRGIGEAPVVAVLQGKVVQVAQDSSGCISVLLEHEGNQESETRGLAVLSEEIRPGALVEQGGLLGRLSARDTTELVFQFRRNGKFVRWADFWLESHPVSDSAIAKFQKALLR